MWVVVGILGYGDTWVYASMDVFGDALEQATGMNRMNANGLGIYPYRYFVVSREDYRAFWRKRIGDIPEETYPAKEEGRQEVGPAAL